MSIRDTLAWNLRALRKARGLSQEELADLVKIDRTYVSALERCRYAATIDVLEKVASALDIDAADLLKRPSER
jgi:transcriptional regulator with XRE-family HTH domain